jgi:uncharacterized protein (DUF169 family)
VNCAAQANDLKMAIGLDNCPVAIRFSDEPDPEGSIDKQVSVCKALEKTINDNAILNLSGENLQCIGGKFYLGFSSLPLSVGVTIWTDYHKAFESKKVAGRQIMRSPKPPGFWPWTKGKQKQFAVLSPLEKTNLDPHVVLIVCNPEQADRITGLVAFSGHGPIMHFPANNTCMSIAYPYVTGKPIISFISRHSREMFKLKIPSDKLFVSLPYYELTKAVENIPRSGYGVAETGKLTIKTMNEMLKYK